VLSSMVEGLIAADIYLNIVEINQTAKKIFGIERDDLTGLSVPDIIRNREIIVAVKESMESEEPVEKEISLVDSDETILQLKGTKLKDSRGRTIGALIVFNDITKISKLESIRRDFVSNVSHELKTPITSIKGYIETLLEGAIDDKENARSFLDIIKRQTSRLNAIIEDLLSLSRIEQEEEKKQIEKQRTPLQLLLESAALYCRQNAAAKNISLEVFCEKGLVVDVNANLLEQAVANLIDNAVKYSTEGCFVYVRGYNENNNAVIEVEDNGPGISSEHHDRIFERFYRVDKARSRKVGGTGLGLAIVKHIAQAHGGTVSIKSEPGKGSRFFIKLRS